MVSKPSVKGVFPLQRTSSGLLPAPVSVLPRPVPRSAAAPAPSISTASGMDDGKKDTKSDGKGSSPPSPSPTDPSVELSKLLKDLTPAEVFSLYRGGTSGFGSGGGKHKHYYGINVGGTTNVPIGLATPATPLSQIPLGTNPTNRLTTQVRLHSLNLRFSFQWTIGIAGATVNQFNIEIAPIRILILWDNMPLIGTSIYATDTGAPTDTGAVCNTLTTTGTAGFMAYGTQACYNSVTHGTRYAILHDELEHPEQWNTWFANGVGTLSSTTSSSLLVTYLNIIIFLVLRPTTMVTSVKSKTSTFRFTDVNSRFRTQPVRRWIPNWRCSSLPMRLMPVLPIRMSNRS